MKMDFRYSREETLGVVELNGVKTYENALEVWQHLHKTILNDGLQAVLLLDRAREDFRIHQLIYLEKWMAQNQFPRHIKIALVDPRATPDSHNPLFETILRNRGWPFITLFSDEAAARAWLQAGPPG